MNRLIIEEENEFECKGVYELDISADGQFVEELSKILKNHDGSKIDHVIIAANSASHKIRLRKSSTRTNVTRRYLTKDFRVLNFREFANVLRTLLKSIPRSTFMLTCLASDRLECVPKKKYEKIYKEGCQIGFGFNTTKVFKSVGDDTDEFFERIKFENISPNTQFTGSFSTSDDRVYFTKWDEKSQVYTFHLSMASNEDELLSANQAGTQKLSATKLPHFKYETTVSKNEQNYELSVCYRKTYIIRDKIMTSTSRMIGKKEYYKIFKNLRKKCGRQNHNQ